MIIDMSYWTRVFKKLLYILATILGLYLAFKLSIFYMPFLIAFIISLIIEPLIRWIMRKTKLTRKSSSIIIFIGVSAIILGLLIWGLITLFSEASNLLQGLNDYFDKAYIMFQNFINSFDFDKIKISDEILNVIQNSTGGLLNAVSDWVRGALNGLLNIVTSIPVISIYFVITVMALYFICVDKVYILDQVEHHMPELWVKKIGKHLRDLIKTLGGYLKAEATLIFVSFIISLIGLYILQFIRLQCRLPITYGNIYRICRCTANTWLWYSNGTLGNNLWT